MQQEDVSWLAALLYSSVCGMCFAGTKVAGFSHTTAYCVTGTKVTGIINSAAKQKWAADAARTDASSAIPCPNNQGPSYSWLVAAVPYTQDVT